MAKMRNLSLDDGLVSFTINNDPNRVIRFNPADPNLMQRYQQAIEDIGAAKDKISVEIALDATGEAVATNEDDDGIKAMAEALKEADDIIRKSVNYMLDSDVYDTVFGKQSPFCIVGKGEYLFEAFLNCISPVIGDAIEESAKASEKRKAKYLKGYHK